MSQPMEYVQLFSSFDREEDLHPFKRHYPNQAWGAHLHLIKICDCSCSKDSHNVLVAVTVQKA